MSWQGESGVIRCPTEIKAAIAVSKFTGSESLAGTANKAVQYVVPSLTLSKALGTFDTPRTDTKREQSIVLNLQH
jgi:hypothetical protein